MKPFDFAVVGGGLAGLTLACLLADAGERVVLFEQKKYPFHRVCGEYISNESVPFLQRLGLGLNHLNPSQITDLELSGTHGKIARGSLGLGGFGMSRFTLDNTLKELAISKGVQVYDGCKVYKIELGCVTTQQGVFEVKHVCLAYGKQSHLEYNLNNAVQSKSPTYTGVKYHVKGDFARHKIGLHAFKGGYCGFSAVEDDLFCLCYLVKSKMVNQHKGDWDQLEQEVLMKNPQLKTILSSVDKQWPQPKTISNIHFELKKPVVNNLPFIGDSAAMIAPLCGNGMSMAFRSADMYFNHREDYAKVWSAEFKTRLLSGRRLQQLFLHPSLANAVVFAAGKSTSILNKLIRQTHGNPW